MKFTRGLGVAGVLLVGAGILTASLLIEQFVPAALAADTDGDGLSDSFEAAYGTLSNQSDSDGDGWNDWAEIFIYGTDPMNADTDNDAVTDNGDSDPLDDGNDADGNTVASWTWAQNLAAPAWTGTSAVDGKGFSPHSGDFQHSLTLLRIDPGYGPAMDLTIHYRAGISFDGPVGNNWDWLPALAEQGNGDVWLYHNGVKHTIDPNGQGGYVLPADGIHWASLVKDAQTGAFTLTARKGGKWDFNSSGQFTASTDRFGNAVTYSYTNGKLSSITDATGHTVTVTWYANKNRVQQITDGDNRTVVLTYNHFGQLAKVRTPTATGYPNGRTYQFVYSNGSQTGTLNDNMVRAIDPKGQVWLKNEFDESDRLTKQYLGLVYYTFAYSGSVTTVTDRAENQRDWTVSGNLPTSLKEYSNRDVRSGDPTYWETTFGHNASSLRTKVVYPRGNRVDTDYDSSGNVTEIRRKTTDTDTDSPTNDLIETFAYDTSNFNLMTSHTDPRGNITTYNLRNDSQDPLHRRVVDSVDYPDVTYLTPDQETSVSFTWNSYGQLATTTDGEGKESTNIYFEDESETGVKKGYLKKRVQDSGDYGLELTTQYDYTNWGTVTSVTNPRSKTTAYTVNKYDWVTLVNPPGNDQTQFTFDANGNVTQRDIQNVDGAGNVVTANSVWTTTYTYDILDNLLTKTEEVTSSTTRTWEYAYTGNGQLDTLTKPEGNEVHYVYDERDLVYQRLRGYGTAAEVTERWDYDGNRNTTLFKNGRNRDWTSEYDLFDRKTKDVNPLGHYTEYVLDNGSNVTEVKRYEEAGATDVLMAHTKQSFDERGRLYLVERGLKGVSSWSWKTTTINLDKRSLPVLVMDPRGKATSFTYDGAGRRTVMENDLEQESRWFYDSNGNVTETETICASGCSVGRSQNTEFTYDDLDRMIQMDEVNEGDDQDKHTWTYAYTSLGVRVEQVDPEAHATTWTHDGLGRVLSESIALGGGAYKTRTWGFDDNDRIVSHKDDAQNETTWAFNARDLMTTETYADTGAKTFDYDDADNLTFWDDPMGTEVVLSYDDNNRLTARDITRGTGVVGAQAEDFLYDALDRMTEAKDDDVTVQLAWDSLGRKTSEKSGPNPISTYGKTTGYTYDDAGNITRIDYPDGSFYVTRTYDDINRLTLVEDGSSNDIVTIGFDSMTGRLDQYTFQNGTTTEFGYDGFGRVTALDHKDSTPTLLRGYDMAYDDVGNMLYEEFAHDSGKGHNYYYDNADRLTKTHQGSNDPSAELASPGSQSYVKKLEYNLSDDSDRTSVVSTLYQQSPVTTSYTRNSVHEYTAIGVTNRTYDNSGNLEDDGTNEYAYDYRNQLITVTRKSDSAVIGDYEYDALGRRTRSTYEDNSEVRFYHDGLHEIEEFDENGTLVRKYVYRTDIDSIAMMESADIADVDNDTNTSELVRLFYHYDGRTNVCGLTGPDETVVESYECDPYGSLSIKDMNGSGVVVSQVGNSFVFQRRRHDFETGLIYFRARHFDPVAGQWMQRDPLWPIFSNQLRSAFSENPAINRDPIGLSDKIDSGIATTEEYATYFVLAAGSWMEFRYMTAESRDNPRRAPGVPAHNTGPTNAMQHCLWACALSKFYGKERAQKFLDAHEKSGDAQGQKANQKKMDELNNSLGMACADDKMKSCLLCCWLQYWGGKLYMIIPDTGGSTPTPPDTGGGTPTWPADIPGPNEKGYVGEPEGEPRPTLPPVPAGGIPDLPPLPPVEYPKPAEPTPTVLLLGG